MREPNGKTTLEMLHDMIAWAEMNTCPYTEARLRPIIARETALEVERAEKSDQQEKMVAALDRRIANQVQIVWQRTNMLEASTAAASDALMLERSGHLREMGKLEREVDRLSGLNGLHLIDKEANAAALERVRAAIKREHALASTSPSLSWLLSIKSIVAALPPDTPAEPSPTESMALTGEAEAINAAREESTDEAELPRYADQEALWELDRNIERMGIVGHDRWVDGSGLHWSLHEMKARAEQLRANIAAVKKGSANNPPTKDEIERQKAVGEFAIRIPLFQSIWNCPEGYRVNRIWRGVMFIDRPQVPPAEPERPEIRTGAKVARWEPGWAEPLIAEVVCAEIKFPALITPVKVPPECLYTPRAATLACIAWHEETAVEMRKAVENA